MREVLSVRIISSHPEELHMVSDNGDVAHNCVIGKHIVRVHRGHGSDRGSVRHVEKKKEGFGPGS